MSDQGLLFDGRELQAVDYDIKAARITKSALDMSRISDADVDFNTVKVGDVFRVTQDYKVAHVDHGADIDDQGFERSEFARTVECQAVKSSFRISAYATAAQHSAVLDGHLAAEA